MKARTRIFARSGAVLSVTLGMVFLTCGALHAQSLAGIPKLSVGVGTSRSPEDVSATVQLLLMLTVLSVAPAILLMCTSFTRIVIVLSLTRSALGTQQVPPNAVLLGLALFLTFFTMAPTLNQVNEKAVKPFMAKQIDFDQAVDRGSKPVRAFMFKQTRESDVALFVKLSKMPRPHTQADIPTSVLAPAFIISELKTAFTIGFVIFIPFLVIDMVVSITLMSMGMMMLPPVLVSLPFKILLFVLVDGWQLIAQSLSLSFH
ncbi:MAG: flagellar type III secretion system pore protein FliP [Armatimonadetes bacterium]|nr:flagellar type III secretion system pore protein FliP [Armatimonadota bacterium]